MAGLLLATVAVTLMLVRACNWICHSFHVFELIPGFADATKMVPEERGLFHGGGGECAVQDWHVGWSSCQHVMPNTTGHHAILGLLIYKYILYLFVYYSKLYRLYWRCSLT